MKACLIVLCVLSQAAARFLEDGSSYSMKFNRCFRVKVQEDNDDDGNSYFYNGAYRAKSAYYASVNTCDSGCGTCDSSTSYVVELNEYINDQVDYVQNYCYSCQQNCRRRLEDANQQVQVDCDTCYNACSAIINGSGGNDETQYLGCQAAYQDSNGLQLYVGPTCDTNGGIALGLFYDEECSIRTNSDVSDFMSFGYDTFNTVEGFCVDCSTTDVCYNIVTSGFNCVDGYNQNGNVADDMRVCKTFKEAMKEWTYAKAKKPSSVPVVFFSLVLVAGFFFGTYVYYVRHKKHPAISKVELMGQKPEEAELKADYAVMT